VALTGLQAIDSFVIQDNPIVGPRLSFALVENCLQGNTMAGFEIIVALLILAMCFTALQLVWFVTAAQT
jgi:hypothetical protein